LKKILTIFVWVVFVLNTNFVFAQENEIGKINNGVYELSSNAEAIQKALEWTFKDGSKVVDLKIEELNQEIYLIANLQFQGKRRMLAMELDQKGNEFVVNEESPLKICSAFACETCKFFFEQRKIVACKCEETGTISNHCRFKTIPASQFIFNFQRALKLKNND
jgi:hypothetical protein